MNVEIQNMTGADVSSFGPGEHHEGFATVRITDWKGSMATLYVDTREQAQAIADAINAAVKPVKVAAE